MKKLTFLGSTIGSVLLLLLLIAWAAGLFETKIKPGLNAASHIDVTQGIEIVLAPIDVVERVPASVAAKHATIISPRIIARITEVYVSAGDSVTKGQVLVELEKADLTASAQKVRASIEGISARLREATLNQDRVKKLYKEGLVAIADLDKTRASQEMLEADMSAAKQTLQAAEIAVSYTSIRSPINGRVVDKFAEPGDTAVPGGKLLSLYNPFLLRIEAHVRESQALSLSSGQKLLVEIPALKKSVTAEIEEIVPAIEPGSRSFLIKASIDYKKELLPGMYAQLQIPAGQENRILIPRSRLAQEGQLSMVWVAENGQAVRRLVKTGRVVNETDVEVVSGLDAGDMILPLP